MKELKSVPVSIIGKDAPIRPPAKPVHYSRENFELLPKDLSVPIYHHKDNTYPVNEISPDRVIGKASNFKTKGVYLVADLSIIKTALDKYKKPSPRVSSNVDVNEDRSVSNFEILNIHILEDDGLWTPVIKA